MNKIYYGIAIVALLVVGYMFMPQQEKMQDLGGDKSGTKTLFASTTASIGAGTAVNVGNVNHCVITTGIDISSTTIDSITYKIAGSFVDNTPAFNTTASETNLWDYLDVVDLEDFASIDGDTGFTLTGDEVRNFYLDNPSVKWLTLIITDHTNGVVTDATSTLSAYLSCNN